MIKLNLGSKYRKLPGFDNLDKIFGWLFQNGLPQYADSSVDGITISHALMFLTFQEIKLFMKEASRVLKINGVIRITEDDTENPQSEYYKTGNISSKPNSLTGPKMMRDILETVGLKVYDVNRDITYFQDKSLMQAYRGGGPKRFFIEGVKKFGIKNISRDDLPQFFIDLGFKVGAEIGVYKGEFSQKLAKAGLSLYAIDPWKVYDDFPHPRGQKRLDFLHEHTKRVLAPYPTCTVIRKTSMNALKDFKDESLDFVYIDGNHDFKYIAEDLYEWTKKVKVGGIVSGHDYTFIESSTGKLNKTVANVLDAYIEAFKIPNLQILAKDQFPSWLFFKP